jgi:hypothetical protein
MAVHDEGLVVALSHPVKRDFTRKVRSLSGWKALFLIGFDVKLFSIASLFSSATQDPFKRLLEKYLRESGLPGVKN